ncbi:MAG: glycosyltransferase [Acidobacteria bacterium]|nr:glycosyltransferase [Acidobacteriota bacterium]
MIEGQDIICFSNDWDGDPLSKKHIMQRLAKRNRVLWVNSIGNRKPTASARDLKRMAKKLRDFAGGHKQVADRIHVFSPLAVPFFGSPVARWINRRALRWSLLRTCRKLGFRNPITWTFVPASADVAGTLGERMLIYHCVDEFSEFTGTDRSAILELERRLMEKSHYVIVSSDPLLEKKRVHNVNTYLVTHGVEVAHFRKACDAATPVPEDIRRLRKPVIGFYGLIEDWVDLPLIRYLALARPEWSFALIGKIATDTSAVNGLPNVHLFGQKPYSALPGYAKAFDVAILPFVINELTLAANPLKLREYLAAGLPVVSSAIPEAERLKDHLRIGRSQLDFLSQLQAVVDSGMAGPQLSISRKMDPESWDEKVEELSRIISGCSTYCRPLRGLLNAS